jgi:ABC-type nitrate/sulfonate/bicarbonate transport system ATPase subunit
MKYKQTLIAIEKLCYSAGKKVILRDINAEIKDIEGRGQIIALLGPSGVGKTTLFNLLSGFLQPTSGRILAHVKEEGMQEVHSHIMGVVSQAYPLFEDSRVYDNLMMVCTTSEARTKCMQLIKDFHLEEVIGSWPCDLSGGQRQRVAILQQVLCSEKYILMDEPFSGLDMVAKCDVCRLVNQVAAADEENTIIIVTHGIEDAIKVADTIWMLGRDRDEKGNFIPGATIKEKINLIEEGFSGTCCAIADPKYFDMVKRIQKKFIEL